MSGILQRLVGRATGAEAPGLRYVHRASNLEDVFIKLTGRELRD